MIHLRYGNYPLLFESINHLHSLPVANLWQGSFISQCYKHMKFFSIVSHPIFALMFIAQLIKLGAGIIIK